MYVTQTSKVNKVNRYTSTGHPHPSIMGKNPNQTGQESTNVKNSTG